MRQKHIREIEDYYARTYSEHLDSTDWFIRTLAATALAKIDTPQTTEKLLAVLKNDKDPLVAMYTWEALRGRVSRLTPDQQTTWLNRGLDLAFRGEFRGDLRVGLIEAIEAFGDPAQLKRVWSWVEKELKKTSYKNPHDSRTLTALRALVTRWKPRPQLIKWSLKLSRGNDFAHQVEYLMGGLNPTIQPIGRLKDSPDSKLKEWTGVQSQWARWFRTALPKSPKSRPDIQALMNELNQGEMPARAHVWRLLGYRLKELTDRQRAAWLDFCMKNPTFVPAAYLLDVLGYIGPDGHPQARDAVVALTKLHGATEKTGGAVLWRIKDVLTQWQDLQAAQKVLAELKNIPIGELTNSQQRAAQETMNNLQYVLSGLIPDSFITIKQTAPNMRVIDLGESFRKGNKALKSLKLNPQTFGAVTDFPGFSLLPTPRKIRNPNNPQWREDLELEKLKVNHFDLCFVIDSTGSMANIMKQVALDVNKMLRLLLMICHKPRIGALFYRHEITPEFMSPCCTKYLKTNVRRQTNDYAVRVFHLTSNINQLSRDLLNERAGGGHNGGAAYGGLQTALTKLQFVKGNDAKKVIVIIGDSPLTAGTEKPMLSLTKNAHKKGYIIHTVMVRPLSNFPYIAEVGGGACTNLRQSQMGYQQTTPFTDERQIASPHNPNSPYHELLTNIVQSAIPKGYHKRLAPLMTVMLEYVSEQPTKSN